MMSINNASEIHSFITFYHSKTTYKKFLNCHYIKKTSFKLMGPKPWFISNKEMDDLVVQTKHLTYNLPKIEWEEDFSKALWASSTILRGKVLTKKIVKTYQVVVLVHKAWDIQEELSVVISE